MPTGVMLLMSWLALKVEMSEGSSNIDFLLNKYRIRWLLLASSRQQNKNQE